MSNTLPNFAKARVLITGDVMLDRYWLGDTQRISPEAPVPVVKVQRIEERPGGAGNVALNIAALGTQVAIQGLLGEDASAQHLQNLLQDKAQLHFHMMTDKPTITKSRVIGLNQQLLRLDIEQSFTVQEAALLLADFERLLVETDVLVLSDYAKGTLAHAPTMIAMAARREIPVLVDPKGQDFERYRGAFLLTPNRREFEAVVGPCQTEADFVLGGHKLLVDYDIKALLITRGSEGMMLLRAEHEPVCLQADTHEVFDVTGAGDTVIGVLAASLAAGADLEQAVTLANMAAGLVVTKLGAATVSPFELQMQLQRQQRPLEEHGIIDEATLVAVVADAKAKGERIVMTNGCFDILHAGHVQYLAQAKSLGDRLVVAVNVDATVRQLKGNGRPVNALTERMQVLAALNAVDWVVAFSEATPARLVGVLQPDILVKGGDYSSVAQIAGADSVLATGGDVKILPFKKGCSSTSVIERIKALDSSVTE